MAPIGTSEFRSRLRTLSRSDLASLVADLWEARDWDVEREGDLVVVVNPETGDEEVLLPVPARWTDRWAAPREPRRPEATVVVVGGRRPPSWAEADDVRVVDAGELRQLLLYAVDRDARRSLLSDHFGVESFDDAERDVDGGPTLPAARRVRRAVAVVVAVLLMTGLLAGPLVLGVGPFGDNTVGSDAASPGPTADASPSGNSYPPGLSADGIEDPDALAVAHVSNLTGPEYTMVFVYREVGQNHTGTIRETTQIVGDRRYASHLERRGTFETDPEAVTDQAFVTDVETYANGEYHYERIGTGDDVRYERRLAYGGRVPIHDTRAAGFIQRTLAANRTSVVATHERDGLIFYRIRFGGDDRPGFRDVEGEALIDERGVVHLLRTRYRPVSEPGVTVTVTLRYTDFRTTKIVEPDWLSEATNETDI